MMKVEFESFKNNLKGKRVAVLGIGISNRPLIKYISNLGALITACDRKSREDIGDICNEFETEGVELKLGSMYLSGLEKFDIIFRTPSLRPDTPELLAAAEKGVYITSEIGEFIKFCPAPIIGITGSDGKTTTSTLAANILKEEGFKVWLGGNIGTPLFDRLEEIDEQDRVVLELSSFQLMMKSDSPDIAVITNLSPNHLDIHKSMEEYIECKKNIFKCQDNNGLLVLNKDNCITSSMEKEANGKVYFFSRKEEVENGAFLMGEDLILAKGGCKYTICRIDEVKLPGMHNIENLLAAFAATSRWCSIESMRKIALTFKGVEHRIEYIKEVDGIKFYNDSIASSPTRAAAGLNSFKQKVILIAGGYDKKIPFDELARVGVLKVKLLILIGVTAKKIEDAFKKQMALDSTSIPILHANNLEEAVHIAVERGKTGDIVTLSPACASFDMFKNFEERGNRFKEIVDSL